MPKLKKLEPGSPEAIARLVEQRTTVQGWIERVAVHGLLSNPSGEQWLKDERRLLDAAGEVASQVMVMMDRLQGGTPIRHMAIEVLQGYLASASFANMEQLNWSAIGEVIEHVERVAVAYQGATRAAEEARLWAQGKAEEAHGDDEKWPMTGWG